MNFVLGKNLEDLHQTHENQRSAPHSTQKCVPKRKKTLLNSVQGEPDTTARSWNVSNLVRSPLQRTVSREKALKTSGSSTTTMRNWIVVDLLGNPLLEEVENRRHFHQLFRQLRVATQTSRRNIVRQDLRHCDNRLGNHRKLRGKELHDIRQLFHRLQHRSIESLDQLIRDAVVPLHLPCGQGSNSAAGRSPPVGLPSSDESSKYSAGPTLVLVPVFWPLGASYAVPTLECEWWVTVASTAATVCCSCRHHERRRRCLRRHAAPRSTSMSTARVFSVQVTTKEMGTLESDALLL